MENPLLFVIGDSISMHYGPYLETMISHRYRYARKTGQEPGLRTGAGAHDPNGGDSRAVRSYLTDRLAHGDFQPQALLINCGLHDIKTDPKTGQIQVPLDEYSANLLAIADLAERTGAALIWVRTTPVSDAVHNSRSAAFHRHAEDLDRYNQVADQIMSVANADLLDLYTFTRGLGGDEVFCDHVHFTEPVRKLQAAYIAGFLDGMGQAWVTGADQ